MRKKYNLQVPVNNILLMTVMNRRHNLKGKHWH